MNEKGELIYIQKWLSGTVWAGLCLIHHHHHGSEMAFQMAQMTQMAVLAEMAKTWAKMALQSQRPGFLKLAISGAT